MTPLLTGIFLDLAFRMYGERKRLFAFLMPTISVVSWYLMLVVLGGYNDLLGWTIHATVGIIFVAGGASLLMSFLTDSEFQMPVDTT